MIVLVIDSFQGISSGQANWELCTLVFREMGAAGTKC